MALDLDPAASLGLGHEALADLEVDGGGDSDGARAFVARLAPWPRRAWLLASGCGELGGATSSSSSTTRLSGTIYGHARTRIRTRASALR